MLVIRRPFNYPPKFRGTDLWTGDLSKKLSKELALERKSYLELQRAEGWEPKEALDKPLRDFSYLALGVVDVKVRRESTQRSFGEQLVPTLFLEEYKIFGYGPNDIGTVTSFEGKLYVLVPWNLVFMRTFFWFETVIYVKRVPPKLVDELCYLVMRKLITDVNNMKSNLMYKE